MLFVFRNQKLKNFKYFLKLFFKKKLKQMQSNFNATNLKAKEIKVIQ